MGLGLTPWAENNFPLYCYNRLMHVRFLCASFILVAIISLPGDVFALTAAEQRAALESQLAQLESQISENQTTLQGKQKERASLERDVAILDAKIRVAKLGIKARDLVIHELQEGIGEKKQAIGVLDGKVLEGQHSIAQMLRRSREIDDTSLVAVALGGSLSDIFGEIDDYQTLHRSLQQSFAQMANVRADLAARKLSQEEQQQEEQDLRQIQVLQQKSLQQNEKDKKNLVTTARGQESIYLQLISTQQKTAAQIRSQLFALRDTKAVAFGDMYAYAKEASVKTGVRPAFILGVLAEESNLGQNLGSGNWKTDMNPTRDQPIFKLICSQLGYNPDSMPVSKKPWYGWGGAMGPAQFIPSTWQQYANRIGSASGQNPPDPWNARTATFAAALYLMDSGADRGSPQDERLAALRYLAGWKNATKKAYAFYGDDVMELADKFQVQINVLGG